MKQKAKELRGKIDAIQQWYEMDKPQDKNTAMFIKDLIKIVTQQQSLIEALIDKTQE